MRRLVPLCAGLFSGCAVTPLTNKIALGDEAYVIVIGEAPDGNTDLFAGSANGGSFYRFTYNRPVEDLARLAPDGKRVAFIRRQAKDDLKSTELVVFDLTTAGEASLALPEAAWRVERLGWSPDGSRLFVVAGLSYATPAPPARLRLAPVPPDSTAAVDTLTAEALGGPPYALVRRCPGDDVCIMAGTDTSSLGAGTTEAIRWGTDSVAYVRNGQLTVRPLRGGHPRTPTWTDAPRNLRSPTLYPGSGGRSIR
jgi:hypothetical protein